MRGPWGDAAGESLGPPSPPPAVTLWLPVLLSLLVQVPSTVVGLRVGGIEPVPAAVSLAVALVGPLALLGARRFPGPVVAVVALAAGLDLLLADTGGPPYVAAVFAVIGAIVRGARAWAFISVAAVWIGALVLGVALGLSWHPGRVAAATLGILLVMGVGEAMRTRRARFAEARVRAARRREDAVQAERVRIARELHDVLAHSLSQINVQAGVGLHLAERQPDQAALALANIKETSRSALDEVRSVLGLLRAEDGESDAPLVPEPDLSRVRTLVESLRGQGPEIVLDLDAGLVAADAAGLPASLQSAAYRIVQESLTNALRHAGARRVDVRITRQDEDLLVEVTDDGDGSPASDTASSGGGRGLLGMHERAELLGGALSAGPREAGGFGVRARLPLPASRDLPASREDLP